MLDVFAIEDGAVEERAARPWVLEPRHLLEHVGHLVAALPAPDVDDHVGVAPFCDLLQQHGLPRAEPTWHGRAAPARDGEEEVERPLARAQRHARAQALRGGARLAHGPLLGEGDVHAGHACHRLVNGVAAGRGDPVDRAAQPGRDDGAEPDRMRLGYLPENRAGDD